MDLERLIAALAPVDVVAARSGRDPRPRLRRPRASTPGASSSASPARAPTGTTSRPRRSRNGAVALVVERPLDARRAAARRRRRARGDGGRGRRVLRPADRGARRSRASPARTARRRRRFLLCARSSRRPGRSPGLLGTIETPRRRRAARRVAHDARGDRPAAARSARCSTPATAACAIEATSHGSALRRLDRVRFAALVFTNLSQDHLDLHGTMEDYFQAKRRLFVEARAAGGGQRRRRSGAARLRGRDRPDALTFGFTRRRDELGPERARRDRPRSCAGASTSRTCSARAAPARAARRSTTTRSRAGSRRCAGVPGRFERGRRGPAVRGRRRLRAHARRARERAPRGARARATAA